MTCDTEQAQGTDLTVSWELNQNICWIDEEGIERKITNATAAPESKRVMCQHDGPIMLNENAVKGSTGNGKQGPLAETHADGRYTFQISLTPNDPNAKFRATVHVEMMGIYGYLSAEDWPLLPVNFSIFSPYFSIIKSLFCFSFTVPCASFMSFLESFGWLSHLCNGVTC